MANSDFVKHYFDWCEFLQDRDKPQFPRTMETRTRRGDITDALRFRVYDPLWMLSRQWQLGEFKGNDAGTAMSVRCRVRQSPVVYDKFSESKELLPLEPQIEDVSRRETPLSRLEAAAHFINMLADYDEFRKESDRRTLIETLSKEFTFGRGNDDAYRYTSIDADDVREYAATRNTRLSRLDAAFNGKIFDGYVLLTYFEGILRSNAAGRHLKPNWGIPLELASRYADWYHKRYRTGGAGYNRQSLSYGFFAENSTYRYENESHDGGGLSWYSFDVRGASSSQRQDLDKETTVKLIPTLASYPGAPNKRLWEFEDRKVFMGNSTGMQAKGNVAFLQYATMYGNDWMVFPLETEFGYYLNVKEIVVYDTFGRRSVITSRAGAVDSGAQTFGQQWQMFTNVRRERNAAPPGLLFPPVFPRKLEGEPLEQVNFLRDEMANMVWAVETRIPDDCGSFRDAGLLAAEVGRFVDEAYEKEVEKARLTVRTGPEGRATLTSDRYSDLKYTLMTSVPYNWIPFVPQHIGPEVKNDKYTKWSVRARDVLLRRGKMPAYHAGQYYPVRPLSVLLSRGTRYDADGVLKENPMYLNEEEVQGVGTQVVKRCQRARWLCGKPYTWVGYAKEIKYTQANSGLAFDLLEDPVK